MKKCILALTLVMFAFGCKEKDKKSAVSATATMTTSELSNKDAEWTILFDGTSFDNWKEYGKDGISDNWKIENEAMVFYPRKDSEKGTSFNLVSKNEYTDFVLSLEWKISEGGNSGIFWGVKELPNLRQPYETGPEIQVLDNDKHPDGKNGTSHQAGALYDMVSPSTDATKPVGEWNTCVITVNHKDEEGSVVLNGTEIVTFPVGNDAWNAMVSKSKFADWEYFGKYTTGKIGLQDHGDVVSYRNIKIKEL